MITMKLSDEAAKKPRPKVGLLLRITPKEDTNIAPERVYRKLISPIEIVNRHLDLLDQFPNDGVWFSHSQARLKEDIKRLIVFTWKNGSYFIAELFFDIYCQESEPFIPVSVSDGTGHTPSEWKDIPEKCWVHITGYKTLSLKDAQQIKMLRSGTTLDQQIKKSGFRAAEFVL